MRYLSLLVISSFAINVNVNRIKPQILVCGNGYSWLNNEKQIYKYFDAYTEFPLSFIRVTLSVFASTVGILLTMSVVFKIQPFLAWFFY